MSINKPLTSYILILCICILLNGCTQIKTLNPIQKTAFALKNVNVIDVVTGEVLANRYVYIKHGKIIKISESPFLHLSGSVKVKDGNNGYLIPGLIDMHVHAYDKAAFELSLSHGVTHVRVMNGVSQHLKWREQQKAGEWLASGMTVSSPIIHSGGNYPLSWRADTAEQARKMVINAKELNYDLIKAYGTMNSDSLTALLAEAKAQGMPVAKHGPHPPKGMPWENLHSLQSVEHAEDIYQGILNYEHDVNQIASAVEKVKSLNTYLTPTLRIFWQLTQISEQKESYLDRLPKGYISPIIAYHDKTTQVKRWLTSSQEMIEHNKKTMNFLLKITKALNDADIPLLVGSDAGVLLLPHGYATLQEMTLMHEAGLSQLEVLQAATINAAKALGKHNTLGQIKQGMAADFMLLSGNPLVDIHQVNQPIAVIKNGIWLDQSDLVNMRSKAIESRSVLNELWVLISNY